MTSNQVSYPLEANVATLHHVGQELMMFCINILIFSITYLDMALLSLLKLQRLFSLTEIWLPLNGPYFDLHEVYIDI